MIAAVISLFAGICVALISAEVRAWAPKLVDKILALAVSRIRSDSLKERMEEEWAAHLTEVPGDLTRLVTAIGFYFAAHNLAERAPFRDRWGTAVMAVRISLRLLRGSAIRSIRRADFESLLVTTRFIVQLWRLLRPALSGWRPRSYANNIVQSMQVVLRVAADHSGSRDELEVKLEALKLNFETGEINPHPSSTPHARG